jgi:hypothetical protein
MFMSESEDISGCWHFDDLGPSEFSDSAQVDLLINTKWIEYVANDPESVSEYIHNSNQQFETDCYTGRGRFYRGDVSVTNFGTNCEISTFCRNTDGFLATPSCTDTNGDVQGKFTIYTKILLIFQIQKCVENKH